MTQPAITDLEPSPDVVCSVTTLPEIHSDQVTVIAPEARAIQPCAAVEGLVREACVDNGHVYVAMVTAEAHKATPWHDHGDRTTYLLPMKGEVLVEFGDDGEGQVRLRADGSVYVIPAHLRHREINPTDSAAQVFLVRVASTRR